ncbi:MAG: helix-turn-helix domain-containing protein [Patescibacteria group bacterium]
MAESVIEANYPLTFRREEAKELGKQLKNRHAIILIGMKKVGISNFLRFFLNNKDIPGIYIKDYKRHLFIPIELNDLIECEIAPFWTLTLKRIVDSVEEYPIDEKIKKQIRNLFLESIQLQDLFFTIDSVRLSLLKITEQGYLPTIFFIRFDRMKNAVTPEFFANLEGIRATNQQVSFVFTSYQPLKRLIPLVFPKTSWAVFFKNIYIPPAKKEDMEIIFNTYKKHFGVSLLEELESYLFELVDGYTQYLQLALIFLHDKKEPLKTKEELFNGLINDERISLQSEELWESLDKNAQSTLLQIANGKKLLPEEKRKSIYLWNTGFVKVSGVNNYIFSKLFEDFVKQKEKAGSSKEVNNEFSKKENLLFNFLLENKDKICEREQIIEMVWPEEEELGVSDWAIDKLAARVRNKLKLQKNNLEIQTIKTRGYKLTEA